MLIFSPFLSCSPTSVLVASGALHPNSHLEVRFRELFLNRFQDPVFAWKPPKIPSRLVESGGSPQPPCWLRSSTRMTSFRKALGAVSRMLCTVLRRVDQASSWKQRMMLAEGRLSSGCCCRHLQGRQPGTIGRKARESVQHSQTHFPGSGGGCSNHMLRLPTLQLSLSFLKIPTQRAQFTPPQQC